MSLTRTVCANRVKICHSSSILSYLQSRLSNTRRKEANAKLQPEFCNELQ